MNNVTTIANENFVSKETIDEDVLRKLKQQNAPLMEVVKALVSLGYSLREAQEVLNKSKYFSDSYANAAAFTENNLNTIEKLTNKK